MNPHENHSTSLIFLAKSIFLHRELIIQMTKREVVGRYKGSYAGLLWSFINPVLMLVVYTFVFSVVFKTKWGIGNEESNTSFAVILFAGLIAHGLLAEVLNRAPGLILGNINYVKKVVFPLEMLPLISLGSAIFHSFVSLAVLLLALFFLNGSLSWTVLLIPIVLLPLIILMLGISMALASLGVYVRDIGQTTGIITTILLFLSPVFFPLSAMPAKYHSYIMANPLTFIIEQAREVLIWGNQPDWYGLSIYALVSIGILWLGYAWFQKTRKGFADVL
jgi:lipopolysaccharide transport system permease protein